MPITIDGFSPEALRRGILKKPATVKKPAATIKLKQQLKKPIPPTPPPPPIPVTQARPTGFQPGVSGPPGLLEGLRAGFLGQVPGLGLVGGLGKAIGQAGVSLTRGLLRSPGTRQAAERLAGRATTLRPLFGRGPSLGQAAAFTGGVIAAETIIGAGEGILDLAQRRLAGAPPQQQLAQTQQRGLATMQHGTGRSIQTLPGVGGMLPPGTTIVKTWNTGTAQFARLADGRIAVQRKDGTIKVYRPQKHIVIPRNPRVGTLIRADKRLNRLVVGLRKVVDRGRTRRK